MFPLFFFQLSNSLAPLASTFGGSHLWPGWHQPSSYERGRTLPTSRYGTGPRCAVWPLPSWGRIPSCNPSGAVRSSGRFFKDFLWVPGFLKANPELVERYSVSVMFLRAFIQVGWESIHPGNSMFHTSKWLAICQLIGALKPFYASILGCASHFAPGS